MNYVCKHCGGKDFHKALKSNNLVLNCTKCGGYLKNLPHKLHHLYPDAPQEKLVVEKLSLFDAPKDSVNKRCDSCEFFRTPVDKGKFLPRKTFCHCTGDDVTPRAHSCHMYREKGRV